jgi:glucans biosynthesis protein C
MSLASAHHTEKLARRYDLDWLRVLVILFVFLFHAGLIFSIEDLGVHAGWTNENVARLLFFTAFLRMPVLFFIAGAGTWFLFRRRSVREFLAERSQRLLIPFIVALLVIVPAMNYVGYRFQAEQAGSSVPTIGDVYSRLLSAMPFEWMHLWFIAYLLIFSLLAAPLFKYLSMSEGRGWVNRGLDILNLRYGVFLFALPVLLIQWSMSWRWQGTVPLVNDWADFVLYLDLFICGFVLIGDRRFESAVDRALPLALVVTIILFLVLPVARLQVDTSQAFVTHWDYSLVKISMGLLGWSSLLVMLGLARRFLSFENTFLRYARDASYPFYLLHMLPLWVVAYFAVTLPLPPGVQFLLITGLSLVLTVALYEVLLRSSQITRMAFGLKRSEARAQFGTWSKKRDQTA